MSDEIDQKIKNNREESKRISLRCPGSHLECQKSFMVVGGWVVYLQLQCLLRSRPPESEIEIELERTWKASRVDLEMVWTRV